MARLTMPSTRLRKKKLLDSLLGDRKWWCWGCLGGAVDDVLGQLGIYIDKTGTVRRPVTRLETRVRSGELLATKDTCGHKETCDCSYFIQIPNAQL
jgi:hypothetical protein